MFDRCSWSRCRTKPLRRCRWLFIVTSLARAVGSNHLPSGGRDHRAAGLASARIWLVVGTGGGHRVQPLLFACPDRHHPHACHRVLRGSYSLACTTGRTESCRMDSLPSAKRFGLSTDIDKWVIRTPSIPSCSSVTLPALRYSINLSGATMSDLGVCDLIQKKLRHQLDPAALTFEVTETVAIADMPMAEAFCRACRRSAA